jgi:hypothetical protein
VAYRAVVTASAPLPERVLEVRLPAGVEYRPGSSRLDGVPFPDPERRGDSLVYRLPAAGAAAPSTLSFSAVPLKGEGGDRVTRGTVSFPFGGSTWTTPPAENVLRRVDSEEVRTVPDFVLTPHYPPLGTLLGEEDRRELEALGQSLKTLRVREGTVTGHTDSLPIARRSRGLFADNRALSLARAEEAERYLTGNLAIPPGLLSVSGVAGTEPVGDNRTEAGRALNRRVEIRIGADNVVETSRTSLV